MRILETLFEENEQILNQLKIHSITGPLFLYKRPDDTFYLRLQDNESFDHIDSSKGNYMYYRYNGPIVNQKENGVRFSLVPIVLVALLPDCKNVRAVAEGLSHIIKKADIYQDDIEVEINKQINFLEETNTEVTKQPNEVPIVKLSFVLKVWGNYCDVPQCSECTTFSINDKTDIIRIENSIEKKLINDFVLENILSFQQLGIEDFYAVLERFKRDDGTYYLRNYLGEQLDHIDSSKGNYMYVRYNGSLRKEYRKTIVPLTIVLGFNDCTNMYDIASYFTQLLYKTLDIKEDITIEINKQENFIEETNAEVDKQKNEMNIVSFSFELDTYEFICQEEFIQCTECSDEQISIVPVLPPPIDLYALKFLGFTNYLAGTGSETINHTQDFTFFSKFRYTDTRFELFSSMGRNVTNTGIAFIRWNSAGDQFRIFFRGGAANNFITFPTVLTSMIAGEINTLQITYDTSLVGMDRFRVFLNGIEHFRSGGSFYEFVGDNTYVIGRFYNNTTITNGYLVGTVFSLSFVDYVKSNTQLNNDLINGVQAQDTGGYLLDIHPIHPTDIITLDPNIPFKERSQDLDIDIYGKPSPMDLDIDFELLD